VPALPELPCRQVRIAVPALPDHRSPVRGGVALSRHPAGRQSSHLCGTGSIA
jgi:hypothetical protein